MSWLLFVLASAALAVYAFLPRLSQIGGLNFIATSRRKSRGNQGVKHASFPNTLSSGAVKQGPVLRPRDNKDEKTRLYKDLYFRVHNLELHPEVLPEARQTLFSLLHEGLSIERCRPRKRSILDIETYSAESLQAFLLAEHDGVTTEWERYIDRRARGGAPELFSSRHSAIDWIKRQAPVKLVDGAWLGHIHKVTTPFDLRGVTKDAWQVLSEELGDGDLEKNHVFLYAKLLSDVGLALPSSHSADFIHPRHEMDDDLAWKAGTAQLLISLFPHEFLPEILGFNLHYELLTMQTLKAARELPEFGISGYYFILHVSIDNADSGHTAMALGTVTKYMEIVREQNPKAVPEIWRRIQAGYILSRTSDERLLLTDRERRVADMLRLKADASHQIHCSSRVRIGRQTLAQWLSPNTWIDSDDYKRDFLADLANAKPWVVRGNSGKSLLMRELAWNGRMFGAFTNKEVRDLQTWIDDLENAQTDFKSLYWSAVQATGTHQAVAASRPYVQDVTTHHLVFLRHPEVEHVLCKPDPAVHDWTTPLELNPLDITNASLDAILPLWFAHPCLLENMVGIPSRTATPLVSHIVRILRAESGYLEEGRGVAGMDEQLRSPDGPSLISLGLELIQRSGRLRPANLQDVLGADSQDDSAAITFAKAMLSFALRPVQNQTRLLGLALAFLDLEAAIADNNDLLSSDGQQALREIVVRKRAAFKGCLDVLKDNEHNYRECLQQYIAGRRYIIEMSTPS